VKTTDPTHTLEHPDGLLLPYLEDMLSPEERLDLERHLRGCERCSSELRELDRITASLRENKPAFCPDSAEIIQFSEGGHDPEGRISRHLKACPTCLALVEACRTESPPETMSPELWARLQERLGTKGGTRVPVLEETSPGFAERFRNWFRVPAFAAGAVAAAILLVVVLYPRDFTVPNMGLSSVTWEGVPKPKAIRDRAVFLMTFKGLAEPLPQKRIDEIYQALKPDMELSERFEVISPSELRAAAKSGEVWLDPKQLKETVESLHKKLNASRVAMITLEPSNGKYSVKVELWDAASGASLNQKAESGIPENSLPDKIRGMVFSMMQQ
jgi:hypothetical protein